MCSGIDTQTSRGAPHVQHEVWGCPRPLSEEIHWALSGCGGGEQREEADGRGWSAGGDFHHVVLPDIEEDAAPPHRWHLHTADPAARSDLFTDFSVLRARVDSALLSVRALSTGAALLRREFCGAAARLERCQEQAARLGDQLAEASALDKLIGKLHDYNRGLRAKFRPMYDHPKSPVECFAEDALRELRDTHRLPGGRGRGRPASKSAPQHPALLPGVDTSAVEAGEVCSEARHPSLHAPLAPS